MTFSAYPQTPFFRAQNNDRYYRQELINTIQKITNRKLIVYEANIWNPAKESSISLDDIQPFVDLLYKIEKDSDIDLLLNSAGGDIDAAEKIVYMCREHSKSFRVIIPEYAKSAATLIALASDVIVMGPTSELGPIDPQLYGPGPSGGIFQTSAQSFLDEFEQIKNEVEEKGELSPAYYPLLEGLNIGFIGMCRNLIERSRQFAEKWLKYSMCKDDEERAHKIASQLCDAKKWLTHGVVIDAQEAQNLGIKVESFSLDDKFWQHIWFLHCCYGSVFRQKPLSKIFESDSVSLPIT